MRDRSNLGFISKILLLIVIIYFPFFLHLGDLPIRAWDESRLVANASEMIENGNYLVTHYHDNPDMWNTKPPLMIWSQVLFVKLMGDQEISYRMPSAIAGFLTCLLIVFLTLRYLKSYWLGLITSLILVTSEGYIGEHVARTGDYDALLSLFTTAYLVFFFLWSETGKKKFLHLFFLMIILAVYTKSIQGLFFLPAILIYLFIAGKAKEFFSKKLVYYDFLVAALVIGAYYLFRESANPGYMKAVYENELGGRLMTSIEGHTGDATFYIDLLTKKQFIYYILIAFLGFFTSFIFEDPRLRRFIKYTSLSAFFYLIIITVAKTKLEWYTAPSIPLLSILAASTVYLLLKSIGELTNLRNHAKTGLQIALVLLVFVYPYYLIMDEVYKPKEKTDRFHFNLITHFLKEGLNGTRDLNGTKLYYTSSNTQLEYYMNQMQKKGVAVYYAIPGLIRPGDHIITALGGDKKFIQSKFNTTETLSYYHISILRIDSVK